MRKNVNTEHIEGRVYQHSLELKTVSNQSSKNFGKQFINGTIEVATDEAGLNVVPVKFLYVTETTSKGGKNKTYSELMKLMTSGKTWITNGAAEATKVSIDTSLALNDFVASDDTMVSAKENQGGFVTIVGELKEDPAARSTFRTDIVITGFQRVEANPEKNISEDYGLIRGAVFDFRNALLPVEFHVRNPLAIDYFENLDITGAEPMYTQVWGTIVNKTESYNTTVESAFGGPAVDTRERKVREWLVTGALKVPYDFGDEKVMTAEELTKASQDRQVHLAEVRKQREEYLAQKNATANAGGNAFPTAPTATAAPVGKFNF